MTIAVLKIDMSHNMVLRHQSKIMGLLLLKISVTHRKQTWPPIAQPLREKKK